ncbi:MAG: sce7726 family protein [Dyella sp.]|uniref:sce7726 family protein n=1 Tax=Dyella sp. TaxID=1869338 RepID=UPI003F818DA9
MREIDVRDAVRSGPLRKYLSDVRSIVIDELAVCLGEARVDIAVVNGKLSGYELKSKNDTLVRLPRQAELYDRVFDEMTLVVDASHNDASLKIIPDLWGVIEVSQTADHKTKLKKLRPAQPNTAQHPYAIAQLLWKDEAIEVLSAHRKGHVPTSKPRSWLWDALAAELPLKKLKSEVRRVLKARTEWRA